MTKTQIAINYFKKGEFSKCFAIMKTFKSVSTDKHRIFEMASDILHCHDRFYMQLGYDTFAIVKRAKEIMKDRYNV